MYPCTRRTPLSAIDITRGPTLKRYARGRAPRQTLSFSHTPGPRTCSRLLLRTIAHSTYIGPDNATFRSAGSAVSHHGYFCSITCPSGETTVILTAAGVAVAVVAASGLCCRGLVALTPRTSE